MGQFFFKIEIFSDHKLYDLGYLLLKKQIRNLFSLRSYCKFSFLRDGLRDTPKVLSCPTDTSCHLLYYSVVFHGVNPENSGSYLHIENSCPSIMGRDTKPHDFESEP